MADEIKIGVGITGGDDIVKVAKNINTLERNVKTLAKSYDKNNLATGAYFKGLQSQTAALVKMGASLEKAKKYVSDLAKATIDSADASKAAAAATKAEATAVKAYAQARREATEANARFNAKAKEAAKDARDLARAQEEAAKDARDLARAQKEVADAHERTRQRYVAGAAAQAQLKQAQRDLSAAYRAGVINIDEYRQALILLNQQNLGNRRSTNNLGVAMQQTGYQVGDFVVQVQSGQNPMVAFGQQATQLVGVLYLLPPATLAATKTILGLTFSVSALVMTLGIAIPILTAIGAAYMRMKKDSDVAGKAADSLSEKINSLDNNLKDYAATKEALAKGVSLDELFATESLASAVKNVEEAKKNLAEVMGEGAAGLANMASLKATFLELFLGVNAGMMSGSFKDLSEKEKEAVKELIAARARLQILLEKEGDTRARNFAESSAAMKQELEILEVQAKYGVGSTQAVNAELAQEFRLRKAAIDARVEAGELDKNAAAALKLQVDRAAALGAEIEFKNTLMEQTQMFLAGEAEAQEAARAKAEAYLKTVESLESELGEAEVTALALGGVDLAGNISAGEKAAARLAVNLGVALGVAQKIQLAQLSLKNKNQVYSGRGSVGMTGEQDGSGEFNPSKDIVNQADILLGLKDPPKTKGSKKSPAEGFAEYLSGLKQQAQLEEGLVGLFGEKRAEEEAVIKARQKYGKETVAKQEAELRGTLRQIEAEKERQRVFDEAKAQQEEVASVIADNFGSAFMSIVDGTKSAKEAFKDMARSIIKQLFQILVVEKMVKSIKSFISPSISAAEANGGAWQGGSKIQAYADGGVVGGPTYFPMSGGKTGLMGEAGPEAIMPLKRGANGKLGVQMEGGGSVTVVNNFSVSANGDDSVKRIVQQQIPRIAEATKAAVVDSKRRGGSYGRAF